MTRLILQGELFDYCIQDSTKTTHPYDALSYVWGNSDNCQSISIGDAFLDITSNLHAALLQLRDHYLLRVLWIDSLCINQGDNEDKARQIQFMAQIYGAARDVIVWLGEAADNSDEALEALRAAGEVAQGSSHGDISHKDSSYEEPDNEEPVPQAISSLLQRPWFRRIWVSQQMIRSTGMTY